MGATPVSAHAHTSRAPWPHRERHLRPQWNRSHVGATIVWCHDVDDDVDGDDAYDDDDGDGDAEELDGGADGDGDDEDDDDDVDDDDVDDDAATADDDNADDDDGMRRARAGMGGERREEARRRGDAVWSLFKTRAHHHMMQSALPSARRCCR
eukprot:8705604-Pyramimonas_sp.AAC.1